MSVFERITFLDKLFFTKHLSVMIKSGIPIGEAIDLIGQQAKNPAMKKLLTEILKDVDNGQTLEKALSRHAKVFDTFFINLVRIGEESGTLEKNLEYLAEQLKKNYEFRKKVQGALLYPAIILLVTFIAGGAISIFVLPKLVDLFSTLDVQLPLSTKILLFIATTMKNYGYLIFLTIIGFVILFRYIITFPKPKLYWHTLLLSIPIIGPFLQDAELTFMCRNIGIMLRSGLTITAALDAQYAATSNLVFKSYLKHIVDAVEKGQSISDKLSGKFYHFIPPLVVKMLGVGEKTGKLDESFTYLGDFFADEVDDYSRNFSTLIEPVILIVIGLIVAFVALAIISPIYQISTGVHR
jgi:type IV pilus assembly protein PilC